MDRHPESQGGVSRRTMEVVVAGLLIVVGGVVMWDSWRSGAGWTDEGPQTGYFPFYVGLLIVLSSLVTAVTNIVSRAPDRSSFVEPARFALVLRVLIPTIIYVALIKFIGIYVSTALFIAIFMIWLGRFPWYTSVLIGVAVPLVFFLVFELWFLVPLPKGPLENYLGY